MHLQYRQPHRSDVEVTDMRRYLEPGETELLELTDSALHKLGRITDEQFAELELVPDFDTDEQGRCAGGSGFRAALVLPL